jgi:hypothetical protein
MQYKIVCKSPLLQYTLEYFLKDNLSNNGIIITDNSEIDGILIGRDIKKPFSKTTLYMQLEKKQPAFETTLEEKLNIAFEKFKQELIEILKEYDGKK